MADLSISEGVSKTGVHTKTHFEDGAIIVQKSFDATPHLQHAEHARQSTAGQRWGEGKFVGHIPPAFYSKIVTIRDPEQRKAAVQSFFRENPAFVMFDRYLK